jgi:folate-binding protein YgfZ
MDRWKALQAGHPQNGGSVQSELAQARDGAVLCDLSGYGLLQVEGEDAEAFLHGQLSSDVCSLPPDRCQLATYNSPKGRVLAALLLWRSEHGFLVQLPSALAEPIRRRLAMFVLRSKVRIALAGDRWVRIGVGGPDAERVLHGAGIAMPQETLGVLHGQRLDRAEPPLAIDAILRLAGQRWELLLSDEEAAIGLWRRLQEHGAQPARFDAWRWLTLKAGIAELGTESQDQFVAQMLNYELVGAISFTKGCYPGQEIIARTQYRGTIKRRTRLAHVDTADVPSPGTAIVSEAGDGQAVGAVVNAAPAPDGGFDLLASVHLELAAGNLHLGDRDGPVVDLLPLPYPIPEAA